MRCPKCGYALPEDSEFCQYCGSKLSAEGENIASPDIPIVELPNSADVRQTIQEAQKASDIEDTFPPKEETDSYNNAAALENNCTVPTPDTIGLTVAPTETPVENQKKKFCKHCGGLIDAKTKKCSSCGKQFFRFPKRIVGIIALVIVFSALAGLNIYQYVSNDARLSDLEQQLNANSTTIAGLEQQIKTKDTTISTQKSTIATQKSTITGFEEKAEYYDEICSFLSRGNIGYAADNFKSSDSIILVKKGAQKRRNEPQVYFNRVLEQWRNCINIVLQFSCCRRII